MKNYTVFGKVNFDFSIEVQANSEEEAEQKAKEDILDYYHLDVHGAYHSPRHVTLDDLYADEDE